MSDLAASTGLPAQAIEAIQQVLAACPAVKQAVLDGSTAKGNHKRGSDIDLTLYAQIDNPALREHIERVGAVFYAR